MLTLTDKTVPSHLHKLPCRRKVVCSFGMWLECGWYQQWGNYSQVEIRAALAVVQLVLLLTPSQLFGTTITKHKNYQRHHKTKLNFFLCTGNKMIYITGHPTFILAVPQRLLLADLWITHVKVTIKRNIWRSKTVRNFFRVCSFSTITQTGGWQIWTPGLNQSTHGAPRPDYPSY
jgi:hypothetical protein